MTLCTVQMIDRLKEYSFGIVFLIQVKNLEHLRIDYFNNERPHSTLQYMYPCRYEELNAA